jgi:hypothetical protein
VPSINCGPTSVHEDSPVFVRPRPGPAEPGREPTAAPGEGAGPAAPTPSRPVSPSRTGPPVTPSADRVAIEAMTDEQLAIEAADPGHRGTLARVERLMRRTAAEEVAAEVDKGRGRRPPGDPPDGGGSARLGMRAEGGAP